MTTSTIIKTVLVLLLCTSSCHMPAHAAAIHIDKITIAVDKAKEMQAFYTAVFDITFKAVQVGENISIHIGKLGDMEVMLCPKSLAGITAKQNTIQLRFVVPDVEKLHDIGLKHGGETINPVKEMAGTKLSSLRDPDGNSIEFIQAVAHNKD